MRDDVVEVPYDQMSPELRALIAYEQNGALDLTEPQRALDRIRRETPVVKWEFGHGFFGLDDIVAAGRNPALVSLDPNTGVPFGMGSRKPLIPLQLDGDLHRRYRRLLDPLLAPKRVAILEPEIRKLADELIDGFADAGQVEFHAAFAKPLPCITFLRAFGMPMDDYDFLIDCKDGILVNSDGASLQEHENRAVLVGDRLDERLAQRLAERKASGVRHEDLIDSFIHLELDGDSLSDEDIVSIMHLFTIAGLDTVASSLSVIVAWFAQHAEERRRVVADPSSLPRAIEELLRYESPVPSGGARYVSESTEVNGVKLERGELIYLCWGSGNLDPETFSEPLTADIGRGVNRHIAFASGIHRCLGSHLARIELRVAIQQLHARLPDYWVTEGEAVDYVFSGVRGARRLPLSFAPAG